MCARAEIGHQAGSLQHYDSATARGVKKRLYWGFCRIPLSTGREWDKEIGLYYRARYYDLMEGRVISKDPFSGGDINLYGYVDSVGKPPVPQVNLYAYTDNNPINFIDPSGEIAIADDVLGGLILGGYAKQ